MMTHRSTVCNPWFIILLDTNLGLKGLTNDLDDNKSDAGTEISLAMPPRPLEVVGWQPTPAQNAFQPSACPVHWSHRYMVSLQNIWACKSQGHAS